MRELATVMGGLDKPMDVNIPKGLVRLCLPFSCCKALTIFPTEHHHDVYVQR